MATFYEAGTSRSPFIAALGRGRHDTASVRRNMKMYLHVVGASDLPRRQLFRPPNSFAAVSVDGEPVMITKTIKKNLHPSWNETVEIEIADTSTVNISIIEEKTQKPIGLVVFVVRDLLAVQGPDSRCTHHLSLHKQGQLIVQFSCTRPQEQPLTQSISLFSPEELDELARFRLQMDEALFSRQPNTDSLTVPLSTSMLSLPRHILRAASEQPRPAFRFGRSAISVNSQLLQPEPQHRNSAENRPSSHIRPARPSSMFSLLSEGLSHTIQSRPVSTFTEVQSVVRRGTWVRRTELPRQNHQPSRPKPSTTQTKLSGDLYSATRKREFAEKTRRLYASSQLQEQAGTCKLTVRRDRLVDDSYTEILRVKPEELKQKLMVKFQGEEGLDFGGVSREFFLLLSSDVFNDSYGLFRTADDGDGTMLQINPGSEIVNPEHLQMFRFLGRLVGTAIVHRQFLSANLAPSFYKMMLGKPIGLDDLEMIDEELHRGLKWMLANPVADVFDETFTTTEDRYGKMETVELILGGAEVKVTDANKHLYVDLIVKYRVERRVQKQFKEFMDGFTQLVPLEALAEFDEQDLELLICGVSVTDVDDWEACTEYRGYTTNDPVVRWFWQCVRSWPEERKILLLQFVTGASRVPVGGFKDLRGSDGPRRFLIERCGASDALPKSHTCFNRLDLPPYASHAELEWRLTTAIDETAGFAIE